MSDTPFFSILVPSYNRPELIGAAVSSVLDNDYSDFELIISDDKSPRQEEISAALRPFSSDARLHIYLQSTNLREAANREFLFQQARGLWQIVLCDDDRLDRHALSALAAAIVANPGADLYTFGYRVIDEHNRISYARRAPRHFRINATNRRKFEELVVCDSFPFWYFHPATFCSHRRVRDSIKPNREIGIGDDLMFLIDYVNAGGTIHVVPEVLMDYRRMSARANLQLNQSAGDIPNLVTRVRILLALEQRPDLHPTLAEFARTRRLRERLVFDPLIWSGVPVSELRAAVPLPAELDRELSDYATLHHRFWHRLLLLLRRCVFFVSLFGVAGLRELVLVQLQRFRNAP